MQSDDTMLIGDSPAFRRALNAARMVAGTDANVLLLGESGTGKELMAREIHRCSRRAGGPFTILACAGAGPDMLAHACGGADGPEPDGTLFVDEVGELSATAQARLLRLLDGPRGTGLRVVASTTRDLWPAVEAGDFRRDLYYRLYVVPLELPPLRERVQDIGSLLRHFTKTAARAHGLAPPRFSATAERQLRRYAWPGNVRELGNFCERMVILFGGRDVGPENLPWEIRRGEAPTEETIPFKLPAGGINLSELEAEVIRQALALTGGNKSRAARLLGLTRDTLLYRMQKHLIKA